MGGWLKDHPDQFDAHIRPLVVRLTDAFEQWLRLEACSVLLAMGDRSAEVKRIVEIAAALPSGRNRALRLKGDYKLDITIPQKENSTIENVVKAWKETHQLAVKLRKKYPITRKTILQDMEKMSAKH